MMFTIDPAQEEQLLEFLQLKPEIYAFYRRGIKGQLDAIITLKRLSQLSEIKDNIKKKFSVLEMKTAIWTDVKEMNHNIAIVDEIRNNPVNQKINKQPIPADINFKIDEIDQKIADELAEDGRISMISLGETVGVSATVAKKRYEKLKENGFLKVTIQISPAKIGYKALCIFFIAISQEKLPTVIGKISNIPDIISIMKTTGNYDLQIYAMIQNLDQMLYINDEIAAIEGISKIDFEINRFNKKIEKWPSPKQYISTF